MSQITTPRLLKYPHAAVFDPSASPELALRLRNPAGLVWEVADKTLRLVVRPIEWDGEQVFNGLYDWGPTRRSYSLHGKTIGALASELREDGHEVAFENPALANFGAHVLISGSGDQDLSNGDHLNAYTSLIWCLFDAYAVEVDEARYQVEQALRQMVMTQAEGEWLDVWATIYGVPRRDGESDAELQARIPKEVFRLRVNGLALEQAALDVADQHVTIDEPWKRMFHLSGSALSGVDHLQDGKYYTYHVIQPVGREGTDWSKALPVLERNRAAGIEIATPRIDFPVFEIVLQPPVEYRVDTNQVDYRGSGIYGTNDQILGVLRLSANEFTLNHMSGRREWNALSASGGLQTAQQIEPHRSVAMASIALSESPASGDENFIFSRGATVTEFDRTPSVSDLLLLSNYGSQETTELVENVTTELHSYGLEYGFETFGNAAPVEVRSYGSMEVYGVRGWSGGWDVGQWVPDWRVAGSKRTDTPA